MSASPAASTHFERELREQPAVLARLLREGQAGARAIAAAVARRGPRFAVLAARGSSDNAARYGQYLFGARNRLVAALATPSVFTHYRAEPDLSAALVIGVSQSGQSPDVIEVLASGRRQGALTVALTNDPRSPLAAAAEFILPLLAGEERAVAATKTYTAQALALAMLSAALRDDDAAWDELRALPEQVQATLDRNPGAVDQAGACAACARLVVVGRGYNLATVGEIALKVKETSGVMADGYSSADFQHGPQAVLADAVPLLAVAPGPRLFDDLERAWRLARERRVPLIVISDRPELLDAADTRLELPTVPEWLSPLVAVVPGQLWSLGLSLARGRQPDAPSGLTKVTHTF